MKNFVVFLCVCVAIAAISIGCTKSRIANNAYCKTCGGNVLAYKNDTDSVSYFLPTAFTPNGDGVNDVFALVSNNLNTDSSTITVYDINGNQVYSNSIKYRWDGTYINGSKCPAGNYPVHSRIVKKNGTATDICTCVTILSYTGGCIQTHGINYYFPDEILPDSGFVSGTNDRICQ